MQHDLNLRNITFLDIIRLHDACDLVPPVQLYITFDANSFITRYTAITKALDLDTVDAETRVHDEGGDRVEDEDEVVLDGQASEKDGIDETEQDPHDEIYEDAEAGEEEYEEAEEEGAEGTGNIPCMSLPDPYLSPIMTYICRYRSSATGRSGLGRCSAS